MNIFEFKFQNVHVEGRVGRRSAFEVEVNGVEVHSKLKTMGFPDFDEVAKIAKDTAEGAEPRQVSQCLLCCNACVIGKKKVFFKKA